MNPRYDYFHHQYRYRYASETSISNILIYSTSPECLITETLPTNSGKGKARLSTQVSSSHPSCIFSCAYQLTSLAKVFFHQHSTSQYQRLSQWYWLVDTYIFCIEIENLTTKKGIHQIMTEDKQVSDSWTYYHYAIYAEIHGAFSKIFRKCIRRKLYAHCETFWEFAPFRHLYASWLCQLTSE